MFQLLWNKKAISNTVFIGSIVVLAVVCVTVGFVGYKIINSLQTENNSLQSQKDSLQSQANALQASINSLQSSNTQLQNNYQNLQSLYNQLKSSDDQLKSSYDNLTSQYQTLLSKLPAGGQGITIESIDSKPYFITPSGIYNVTIRNHDSSDIHVTALKLYYGAVLRSSGSVLATIPANSAVTIHQYLEWDSLNYNPYILKIETLEGYNVTSDPLSSG